MIFILTIFARTPTRHCFGEQISRRKKILTPWLSGITSVSGIGDHGFEFRQGCEPFGTLYLATQLLAT
jgi:hypothetical protein